jgi:hypothetical protein
MATCPTDHTRTHTPLPMGPASRNPPQRLRPGLKGRHSQNASLQSAPTRLCIMTYDSGSPTRRHHAITQGRYRKAETARPRPQGRDRKAETARPRPQVLDRKSHHLDRRAAKATLHRAVLAASSSCCTSRLRRDRTAPSSLTSSAADLAFPSPRSCPDASGVGGSRTSPTVDAHATPPPATRRCQGPRVSPSNTRPHVSRSTPHSHRTHTVPSEVWRWAVVDQRHRPCPHLIPHPHRERRATNATLHRKRRILHNSVYSHHRERRAIKATLHRERRILHRSVYSHHREKRATEATLHRDRRITHNSIRSHHREPISTKATLHRERRIIHNSICSHH